MYGVAVGPRRSTFVVECGFENVEGIDKDAMHWSDERAGTPAPRLREVGSAPSRDSSIGRRGTVAATVGGPHVSELRRAVSSASNVVAIGFLAPWPHGASVSARVGPEEPRRPAQEERDGGATSREGVGPRAVTPLRRAERFWRNFVRVPAIMVHEPDEGQGMPGKEVFSGAPG